MKINVFAVFVFLLIGFSLKAQQSTVIVVSVKGQIEYSKDNSIAKERLIPGDKIANSGTIFLPKEAKVDLLYNGKLTSFEKEGTYNLNSVFGKKDNSSNLGFARRFWNFISEGLYSSDDKDALNEYGEQILAVEGGVQGFSLEESTTQIIMPADGKIGIDIVTFQWHRSKNSPAFYHFNIYHSEKETLVFKAITRDTSITLDFSQLVFLSEESYDWFVEEEGEEIEDGEQTKSELKTFQYIPNANETIIRKAEKVSDYKKAGNFEKKWMEAVVMEQEDFIYDAYCRYNDLRTQEPDNLLVKKLFATFLVRQNLTQEAIEQIKK